MNKRGEAVAMHFVKMNLERIEKDSSTAAAIDNE